MEKNSPNTFVPRSLIASALLIVLLVGSVLPMPARELLAQTPAAAIDKPGLHQALLDLTNAATVMCVAAHPDDEDGTTLTVLRRKYGVHTVSLFSTYGEGGQNAVGPELYEQLGVIRARETAEAARIQGSEPYFLGLRDFGFSKSADEAFRIWGHDEALRRMVFKIRELRPDVIITNHDTTSGHGHHQATGRLVLEAFEAAANPQRFPEQLATVAVWQPQRLFVRSRSGMANNNQPPATVAQQDKFVTIDPNERDPIRGTIYAEQALDALHKHASQGPWPATIAERLRGNPSGKLPLIRYRLVREATGAGTMPAESKTFLEGLTAAQTTAANFTAPTLEGRALTEFIDQPDRVLNALIDWRRRTPARSPAGGGDIQRSRLMANRADQALAVASGVALSLSTRSSVLVPGVLTTFTVNVSNAGNRTAQINQLSLEGWGEKVPLDAAEGLAADTETIASAELLTPTTAVITVPQAEHLYDGVTSVPFVAKANFDIDGAKFSLTAERSIDVVPVVEIKNISPSPCVSTEQTLGRCHIFHAAMINHLRQPFTGILKTSVVASGHVRESKGGITLTPNEKRDQMIPAGESSPDPETFAEERRNPVVTVSVEPSDSKPSITERSVKVIYADARVAKGLRVGYVPSFDQTLKESLAVLGVSANELSVETIQKNSLSSYDTIVIDNRGYFAHPELIAANAQLMKYVEDGGTLIVFYHKDGEWNPNPERNRPQLAPYPIILGEERVTEEVAPIKFLQPRHPLLNYPNKIKNADFNDWVQERGLYYPREWDKYYTELFSSSDQGEKPLSGGMLVASYGRGNYIYTSMVWYRQLSAGVPGAYRMFANMISYGK